MKLFSRIIICVISLTCLSCDPLHDNMDYPSKVIFSESGGEQTLHGSEDCISIAVDNGQESIYALIIEHDDVQVQIDWLTIKTKWGDKALTLIAAPKSEVDDPKEIIIECNFGRKFGAIKVIRK